MQCSPEVLAAVPGSTRTVSPATDWDRVASRVVIERSASAIDRVPLEDGLRLGGRSFSICGLFNFWDAFPSHNPSTSQGSTSGAYTLVSLGGGANNPLFLLQMMGAVSQPKRGLKLSITDSAGAQRTIEFEDALEVQTLQTDRPSHYCATVNAEGMLQVIKDDLELKCSGGNACINEVGTRGTELSLELSHFSTPHM